MMSQREKNKTLCQIPLFADKINRFCDMEQIFELYKQQMILFISTYLLVLVQSRTYSNIIAVQERNQIYTSYIPYLQTCDYSHENISPGRLQFIQLDDQTTFEELKEQGEVQFWTVVNNGLNIMLLDNELAIGYDGYILINSKINEKENRQFLLYNLQNESLIFYTTFAYIDVGNMNLTIDIVSEETLTFNKNEVNCQKQNITVQYFGDNSFLYMCKQTGIGFTFYYDIQQKNTTNIKTTPIDLSSEDILLPIEGIYPNPDQLSYTNYFAEFQIEWNMMILSEGSNSFNESYTTYFIQFSNSSSNFTAFSLNSLEFEIFLIIDRIWGSQQVMQENRWEEIYDQITSDPQLFFPGNIVSLYINERNDVYVESQKGQLNYLNIFDNGGSQIANVSYPGYIVFYGVEHTFMFNTKSQRYYRIFIQRPIFSIYAPAHNNQTTSEINISLECNQMTNMEINYEILWTSPDYPSAKVYVLDSKAMVSYNSIFVFNLQFRYLPIGPAYNFYVNSTPLIQATMINSAIIEVNSSSSTIIDVAIAQAFINSMINIVYAHTNVIYSVKKFTTNQVFVHSVSPCGFQMINSGIKVKEGYILANDNNEECYCKNNFQECKKITKNQLHQYMRKSYSLYSPQYLSYLQERQGRFAQQPNNTQIKKNLFGMIDKGYIISILTNNSIIMTEMKSNKVVSMIEMSCSGYNQTDGNVYFRQFYDPLILLYCYEDETITEYIIRKGKFVFERIIPLYGFRVRKTDKSLFIGFNFAYLNVDPIINIYPSPQSCCVLRLDPCEYTVSVMKEIIRAKNVVKVFSKKTIDVVLYTGSDQTTSLDFFKIYFSDVLVSLNQTNKTTVAQSQKIQISFLSDFYNFASIFTDQIIFNFTVFNITTSENVLTSSIILEQTKNIYGTPVYYAQINYDYNQVCGPVLETLFVKNASNESFFEVSQNSIVTPNKILGQVGAYFLEIIDPSEYHVQNFTLNGLILVVAEQYIYVYAKQKENLQMQYLDKIPLPETSCTYNMYEQVNLTSAQFISDCEAPNYQYLTPLLSLNYENQKISYEFYSIFIPRQLRKIFTILREGKQTLLVGIGEGPMKSQTGKLFLCGFLLCAPLYISSQYEFLLNYDAYVEGQFYIVMSIDPEKIEVFINPVVEGSSPILSNYTVQYSSITGQNFCSIIQIVKANMTDAHIVISCSVNYFYGILTYQTGQIKTINTFNRYPSCSLYDKFNPEVVLSEDDEFVMIATVCSQNEATLRLTSFENINQSVNIYTGYLQIFTLDGPKCGETYDTIRVIPLSTSMRNPLFMVYNINSENKLIYSQINGILVDNYLSIQPTLQIEYTPLTTVIEFPQIIVQITNPYNCLEDYVKTTSSIPFYPTTYSYIVFSFYCFLNLVALLFLVCFCVDKQKKKLKSMIPRESENTSVSPDFVYEESLKAMMSRLEAEERASTRKTNRVSEIQLFYIKNK